VTKVVVFYLYYEYFYLSRTEEIRNLAQAVAVLGGENLPLPVAEIPWDHNILLLEKLKSRTKRLW
jgi:hypothetical protein